MTVAGGRRGVQPSPLKKRWLRIGVTIADDRRFLEEELLATGRQGGAKPRRRPGHADIGRTEPGPMAWLMLS